MYRETAAFLLTGFLLLDAPLASSPQPPAEEAPQESFEDKISVSEVEMVVRVVDTWGKPILDLKPEDFRVRLGKAEVPVAGLDWISAEDSAILDLPAEMAPTGGEGDEVTVALPAPGRLVVFFVQADLNPTRISGQLRMRNRNRKLLDSLHPRDQVAVVSFDSHLKLWQDFSLDREAVHAALDHAVLYSQPPAIQPEGEVSLARRFDFAAARKAATAERALELTARALEALPGEKMMIFLGHGFGNWNAHFGTQMKPSYAPAVRALQNAQISVFALDITSADGHSLEVGLQQVAADTGGIYLSTFRLPDLATEILSETISGYYILVLDVSQMPDAAGEVQVELKSKRGTVTARPLVLR